MRAAVPWEWEQLGYFAAPWVFEVVRAITSRISSGRAKIACTMSACAKCAWGSASPSGKSSGKSVVGCRNRSRRWLRQALPVAVVQRDFESSLRAAARRERRSVRCPRPPHDPPDRGRRAERRCRVRVDHLLQLRRNHLRAQDAAAGPLDRERPRFLGPGRLGGAPLRERSSPALGGPRMGLRASTLLCQARICTVRSGSLHALDAASPGCYAT